MAYSKLEQQIIDNYLTVQDLQLNPGALTIFGIDTAVTKKKASLVA